MEIYICYSYLCYIIGFVSVIIHYSRNTFIDSRKIKYSNEKFVIYISFRIIIQNYTNNTKYSGFSFIASSDY